MKLEEFFPLIFCINMDSRPDRWEKTQKEFEKIGIKNVKRFSAIEYEPSWFGCYLSHMEILSEARRVKENVLIFEDDIEFVNFNNFDIEQALDEMNNFYWWDMLYLGGNILKPFYQVSKYWAKLTHCQSTHAYGVNHTFVPRLRDWFFSQKKKTILDVMYADGVIPYRNCYITIPSMVAIQRTDYSDIEKREMNYDIPIRRYEHFLRKKYD